MEQKLIHINIAKLIDNLIIINNSDETAEHIAVKIEEALQKVKDNAEKAGEDSTTPTDQNQ